MTREPTAWLTVDNNNAPGMYFPYFFSKRSMVFLSIELNKSIDRLVCSRASSGSNFQCSPNPNAMPPYNNPQISVMNVRIIGANAGASGFVAFVAPGSPANGTSRGAGPVGSRGIEPIAPTVAEGSRGIDARVRPVLAAVEG